MKYFIHLLISLLSTQVFAQENNDNWILDRFNIYTENDLFTGTDDSYSSGESFNLLYFIPEKDYPIYKLLGYSHIPTYSYITFELANKLYTPTDTLTTSFIPNDRPYASWSYFRTGIHKASTNELRSLSIQVGIIGSASLGEELQSIVHKAIGSPQVNGWENQLKNELGVNFKYTQKWRFQNTSYKYREISIMPFTSTEFGNVAINASAGVTTRFGWNIPKDFGVSSLDIGADPGIPVKGQYQNMRNLPWGFSFNLTLSGTAVARDIFLDGNTFRDSHSVQKENFVGYFGIGFTAKYKNFIVDFIEVHNTRQFKKEKDTHKYGSLIFSYLF